ncbi:heavy-metal-associated domain-containing protein [Winogradskyella aurantiaca]|uniref:heavy-metal-associated domain-containing protein n=1 Tax=Winogradskyella aurantiaca TaxID=2219558 RepID=UPI000E1C5C41|nr:heavy metal-associated domain-containing protein [Winogradskyella aurantiaca]
MKTVQIEIQNLKCHGCAHTIETQLSKIEGVSKVNVDNNTNQVSIDLMDTDQLSTIIESLSKMGYPAVGEDNGLSLKAKSFVSCAVGRMTK